MEAVKKNPLKYIDYTKWPPHNDTMTSPPSSFLGRGDFHPVGGVYRGLGGKYP